MTIKQQQKFLVTGGAGYLGCVLLPDLLKIGKVYVVDNLYFGKKPLKNFINHENFNLICEDAFNISAYEDVLSEADVVIHLAGLSNDPSADLDPSLTIRSNFLATMALGRKAKELGVKRFINISSCSVYGSRSDFNRCFQITTVKCIPIVCCKKTFSIYFFISQIFFCKII